MERAGFEWAPLSAEESQMANERLGPLGRKYFADRQALIHRGCQTEIEDVGPILGSILMNLCMESHFPLVITYLGDPVCDYMYMLSGRSLQESPLLMSVEGEVLQLYQQKVIFFWHEGLPEDLRDSTRNIFIERVNENLITKNLPTIPLFSSKA